jgi:membrane protease YdiL (CAAX protease family)
MVFGLILALGILLEAVLTGWMPAQELPGSSDKIIDLMNRPPATLLLELATVLITFGTVWLAGRILDRRRFVDFGFHFSTRWWMDLGFGLFLGAFLMGAVFLLELFAGWITVEDFLVTETPGEYFFPAILIPAVFFLCVGVTEELSSRGYQLKNYAEGLKGSRFGSAGAILAATFLSSILFGLMHAANPNITWISILNLIAAGIFLALGYILSGELAIPIGIHITWNFFQGNVFGFPVSGIDPIAASFISIRQSGPGFLTGGAFGPEGGLVGVGAMCLGCGLILLWIRATRGKISLADTIAESPKKNRLPDNSVLRK